MSDTTGPGPAQLVRDFRQRLRDLRKDSGNPSGARMIAALTSTGLRLSPATLSEFATDKRPHVLPQRDFVEAYVTACLRHSRTPPEEIERQVYSWLTSRNGVALAIDTTLTATPEAAEQETAGLATAAPETHSDYPATAPAHSDYPATMPAPRRATSPTPPPAGAGARPSWRHPLVLTPWVLLVVVLVAAAFIVRPGGPAVANDPGEKRLPVGQPDPASRNDAGCLVRAATIRNSLDAPMGTALLEQCGRRLDITTTDHLADGYCSYVIIDWPDGTTERTDRACPAGEVERIVVPLRASTYQATLVAHNAEKSTPN